MKKNKFETFLIGKNVDLVILDEKIVKNTDWYQWMNFKKIRHSGTGTYSVICQSVERAWVCPANEAEPLPDLPNQAHEPIRALPEAYVLPLAGSEFANYLAVRFLNPPNSIFPMSAGTFLVSLSSCPFIVTGMNGEALGSIRQRMDMRFNDTQNLQANPDPLKIPLKVGGFRRSSRPRRNHSPQYTGLN